jgi:hemolysin activation/secretion protein
MTLVAVLTLFVPGFGEECPEADVSRSAGDGIPHPKAGEVFAREIAITGNTVFSSEELAEVTRPYTNRVLSSEDLETLRRKLSRYYIQRGYVNSGAIIPDQKVVEGVITFKIIEGRLTQILVEGNRWLSDTHIRERLALGAGPPLQIEALQRHLQLLQEDERIHLIHAELLPGLELGQSLLKVVVEERRPFSAQLELNNYQSPNVGAERALLELSHTSLTGRGDRFSFACGRSEGLKPQIDAAYSVPLTAKDTQLHLRYRENDFDVIKAPFAALDVESESETYEIALRHPIYRRLNHVLTISLSAEHLHNRTSLLGEAFSFSPGAVDGESTVNALRFSQEWLYRTQRQVVAAHSRFSAGLDAFDATISPFSEIPDGRFFSWAGQFQWTRILDPLDMQVLFRAGFQIANDPLLPLEQIAVGGRYTVRGYRENTLVRDQALLASLEFRIPVASNRNQADFLQIVPFMDYGTTWNVDLPTPSPRSLWSLGLGFRWGATLMESPFKLRTYFEIFWGYQLKEIDFPSDHDLQDDGIHFQFVVTGF